jgi:hypothetical protein
MRRMAGACLARCRGAGRLVRVALAALLAGGCGDDESSPASPGSAAKPAAATEKAAVAAPTGAAVRTPAPAVEPPRPAPAKVVLLEAGRKPRRALRYELPGSYRDKLGMTIRVGMEMGSGAEAVKIDLPVIRLGMDVTSAGERSADRVFRFELTDADAQAGDKMFASMQDQLVAQMKKAVGAAGTLVVDPRGVNREVNLELPPDMDPQMSESMRWSRQAMEQMSAPLPEEAVGKGARWQVEQLVQLNGLAVVQRTEFELTALKRTRASLKTTITQRADPQIVALPGVPAGFKAELLSHSGKGSGRIDLDLGRLVPIKSTVRLETETSMRITGQGQVQPMQTRARAEVSVGRR